jgi:acyl-CoA thioesterase
MGGEGKKGQQMDSLKKFFQNDRFAATNNIELVEARPGYAKTRMKAEDRHLNGVNTVQGGAIFTLADLAFAAASNAHGTIAVALNVNISFLKAGFSGDTLIAEAKENSLSSKVGSYTVEVRNEKGDLIALFQGTAYRKKDPLPI